MGQADCDTQPGYAIWPERLATDLSLCNVSPARLNSLRQEQLGVNLRIKAGGVGRPHVLLVDSKPAFYLYDTNFKALTGMNSCPRWDWWSWNTYQITCLYTNRGLCAKFSPARTIFGALIKANVLPFTAYHSTGGNNRSTKVTGIHTYC